MNRFRDLAPPADGAGAMYVKILDLAEVLVNACGPGSRGGGYLSLPSTNDHPAACDLQVIGNAPIRIAEAAALDPWCEISSAPPIARRSCLTA